MNIENIQKAINVMQRVIDRGSNLNMLHFQNIKKYTDSRKTTEEEIHACGTSACFAGWIAVSPEWKEFGGRMDFGGAPFLNESMEPEEALAKFLGLDRNLVMDIIYPELMIAADSIYGKIRQDVTAQDVIDILVRIKNGEEVNNFEYRTEV